MSGSQQLAGGSWADDDGSVHGSDGGTPPPGLNVDSRSVGTCAPNADGALNCLDWHQMKIGALSDAIRGGECPDDVVNPRFLKEALIGSAHGAFGKTKAHSSTVKFVLGLLRQKHVDEFKRTPQLWLALFHLWDVSVANAYARYFDESDDTPLKKVQIFLTLCRMVSVRQIARPTLALQLMTDVESINGNDWAALDTVLDVVDDDIKAASRQSRSRGGGRRGGDGSRPHGTGRSQSRPRGGDGGSRRGGGGRRD